MTYTHLFIVHILLGSLKYRGTLTIRNLIYLIFVISHTSSNDYLLCQCLMYCFPHMMEAAWGDNVTSDIYFLLCSLLMRTVKSENSGKNNTCLGVPCPTNHSPLLKGLQWHLRGNLMAVIPESLPHWCLLTICSPYEQKTGNCLREGTSITLSLN